MNGYPMLWNLAEPQLNNYNDRWGETIAKVVKKSTIYTTVTKILKREETIILNTHIISHICL